VSGRLIPLVAGALFGAGVCISGMVRPSKVLGFLDLGGAWDATLLCVMASALAIHVVAWRVAARASKPRFGAAYPGPAATAIDARLLGGAALFGIGWGVSGYCPGPAVVSIVSGARGSIVFVAAMIAGMLVARAYGRVDDG
jgi:uncharacterized membrane protein YedE/YeeE